MLSFHPLLTDLWLTALAVLLPAAGAVLVFKKTDGRRFSALTSMGSLLLVTAAAFNPSAGGPLGINHLAAAPAILFASVMLALFLAAPKRDMDGSSCARMLIAMSGNLLVYSARDLPLLLCGWVVSSLPLIYAPRRPESANWRAHTKPALLLLLSSIALGLSVALLSLIEGLGLNASVKDSLHPYIFGLAVAAALVRSGVLPFHSWISNALGEERLLVPAAALLGQPGAFLIARLAIPLFGDSATAILPLVGDLALVSTIAISFMAFAERVPRRILAMVIASQSGFIITGLALGNIEGVTGSLTHWLVVAVSASGLLMVLRGLEARCGAATLQPLAGLGSQAPRMAVLFVLFGLALVGLPGTLGFCAEDLLFHGALESHPFLGLALPLATALNAIHLFRLASNLFFGRRSLHVPTISDILPRERWALSTLALFLIGMGLMPHLIVQSRIEPAHAITSVLQNRSGGTR